MSFKIAVIGDRDTVIGFSLAGVQHAHAFTTKDEALVKLGEFFANKEIGLVLLTHRVVEELGPEFHHMMRRKGLLPLVLRVPDKTGYTPKKDELRDLIRRTVGVEILMGREVE